LEKDLNMATSYAQIAKVIEPVHLLFTGANGTKTYGITVENINWKQGYSKTWMINDNTLLEASKNEVMGKLGLSESEYESIINDLKIALDISPSIC
jgi:hypothetical protein